MRLKVCHPFILWICITLFSVRSVFLQDKWRGLQSVHVLKQYLSIHNVNNIERKKIIVRPPGRFLYSLHLLNTSEYALSVQTPNLLSYYLSESYVEVTLYAFICRQIFLRTLLRWKSSLCFYSKKPVYRSGF